MDENINTKRNQHTGCQQGIWPRKNQIKNKNIYMLMYCHQNARQDIKNNTTNNFFWGKVQITNKIAFRRSYEEIKLEE
jgi:hypothetical protein